MTKKEAIKALREGKKIRHIHFLDNEYICLKDGVIVDENGLVLTDFWEYRPGIHWLNDWSIHK